MLNEISDGNYLMDYAPQNSMQNYYQGGGGKRRVTKQAPMQMQVTNQDYDMSYNERGGKNYKSNRNTENESANYKNIPDKDDNLNSSSSLITMKLSSIFESEKIIRSLELEVEVTQMKKKMINSMLEHKKKQAEAIKADIKKFKTNNDKMKDQINILTRENEFLHEMIVFSSRVKDKMSN